MVINHIVGNLIQSVEEIRKDDKFSNLEILAITDRPDFASKYSKYVDASQVIYCNFQDEADIANRLKPYMDNIVGVICRGDRHIQYLRKIAQFLPKDCPVASVDALTRSTNKKLMRESFLEHFPEITPKAVQVKDILPESLDMVEKTINYPLIVKPANLFSSLLIQICQNRQELSDALEKVFSQIQDLYKQRDIHEQPEVIVEEFMEGDFYSIDAYVMDRNSFYFCPPVAYVPAQKIGIDDFFLYKRFIPTELSNFSVEQANQTVQKALTAVGLSHSAAHVELVLTAEGWKIIEIGPRLGRFRNMMYGLAYSINHSLNDVKIHLGIEPDIPTTLIQSCSAYSIYPTKEGILKEVTGLNELSTYDEIKQLKIYKNAGDECVFAKHGGSAIVEFVVASKDLKKFNEVTDFIERKVHPVID